jgi:hypothetical protein
MTTSQPTSTIEDETGESAVVQYLKEHPGFFERHPQLLAAMKVNHPTSGQTISLIERQVAQLREQNREMDEKLMELVAIARENEQLSRQLHMFSSELLKARSLSDVVAVTQDKVREIFHTDFVALCLVDGITDDVELRIDRKIREELFKELFESDKPVCGRISREQTRFMFQGNAAEIASTAIIPLKAADTLGLLGLGSRDIQRFSPGMGHLFLSHLGDLVCSALAVHTHPA